MFAIFVLPYEKEICDQVEKCKVIQYEEQSPNILYDRNLLKVYSDKQYSRVTRESDNHQCKGLCCFVLPLLICLLLYTGYMKGVHGSEHSSRLDV